MYGAFETQEVCYTDCADHTGGDGRMPDSCFENAPWRICIKQLMTNSAARKVMWAILCAVRMSRKVFTIF